jgi:hypothetical protein
MNPCVENRRRALSVPGGSNPPIPRVESSTRVLFLLKKSSAKGRNVDLLLPHLTLQKLLLPHDRSPPRTRPPVSCSYRRRTSCGRRRRAPSRAPPGNHVAGVAGEPTQHLLPSPRTTSMHAGVRSHGGRRRTPTRRRRLAGAAGSSISFHLCSNTVDLW